MLGSGNNRTVNAAGVCAHEDRRNDCNRDWSLHLVRKRLSLLSNLSYVRLGNHVRRWFDNEIREADHLLILGS